jgi:hypothetical protein
MAAIARDFDPVFRVFAALAAILFIIPDDTTARGVGTLLLFMSSHAYSPWGLLAEPSELPLTTVRVG